MARSELTGYRGRFPYHHRLFDVPEVLEHVLLQLPMVDLLLSQRVCPEWKALIFSSPTLQKALFFRSSEAPTALQLGRGGVGEDIEVQQRGRQVNELLARHFPHWYGVKCPTKGTTGRSLQGTAALRLQWLKDVRRLAFLRRDASWRRMLVVQPAVCTYEEARVVYRKGGPSLCRGELQQPGGVRMAILYDRAQAFVEGTRVAGFRINFDEVAKLSTRESNGPRIFGGDDRITATLFMTVQCSLYESLSPPYARSVAYEELALDFQGLEDPYGRSSWDEEWWDDNGYVKKVEDQEDHGL